jgi:hypothetical protein
MTSIAQPSSLATPTTASGVIACTIDGVTEVPVALTGWSVAEHTGSATAHAILRDGTVTGTILGEIELASGAQSESNEAVDVVTGAIYLQIVSGSIEGTVFWG